MYSAAIWAACSGVGCGLVSEEALCFLPQQERAHAHKATRMNGGFIGLVSNQQSTASVSLSGIRRTSSRRIVIVWIVPRQSRQEGCGMAVPKVYITFFVVPQRDQVARRHKPAVVDETRAAVRAVQAFGWLAARLFLRQHNLVRRQLNAGQFEQIRRRIVQGALEDRSHAEVAGEVL